MPLEYLDYAHYYLETSMNKHGDMKGNTGGVTMHKRTGHESRRYEGSAGMFKGSQTIGRGKPKLNSGRHPSIPEDVVKLDLSKLKWRTVRSHTIAQGKAIPIPFMYSSIPEDVVQLDLSKLKWGTVGSLKGGLGKADITTRHGLVPVDAAQLELDTLRDYEQQFDFQFPSYQMEIANCLNDYLLPA